MGRKKVPAGSKRVSGLPRAVYNRLSARLAAGPYVCDLRYAEAYKALGHLLGVYGEVVGSAAHYVNTIRSLKCEIDRALDGPLKANIYRRLVDHVKKNRTRRMATLWKAPVEHGPLDKRSLAHFGFTLDEFISHFDKLFKPGMTWDRLVAGDVQIDHVIPVRCFDLSNKQGLQAAYSLENTQPLWRGDNARKARTLDRQWLELFGEGCLRE